MTPRSASLRVAHQRDCPNASRTALDSLDGCTCSPSYYTHHRGRDGRPVKGKRVRDRRTADRALERLLFEIGEQRVGLARERNIAFPAWRDEFLRIVEQRVAAGELKPRTLREYRDTLTIAVDAIGHVSLREIGPAELRRFYYDTLTSGTVTRAKRMRELGACLAAAVDEGYADANPVSVFMRRLKLRPPKRGKAPFEDGELDRLWTAFQQIEQPPRSIEPVYRFICRASVETGARLGELIALDWPQLNLGERTLEIVATWNSIDGLVAPKDREERTVHLTDWAAAVLEEWVALAGVHESGPVFPNPAGGRLLHRSVGRNLDRAMTTAGIPKLHPQIRLRRSFHSLRYTTSNLLQRRGFHPRLIEQMLGHGTLELTYGLYGGWTPDQLAAEAARVKR